MRDFWYHFFNDPIRGNPWAMFFVGGALGASIFGLVLAVRGLRRDWR